MKRFKQVLLILMLGGLIGLSFMEKDLAFTAEEAASYSALGNKVICPVTGEAFNITESSEKSVYQGKIYYFCCPGCKAPFEKNPEKYLKKVITMAKDPVCGMEVEEGKICTEYEGKKYCFCSQSCREAFSKNPEKYLK